jgi:Tol biopolymer transport system component
MGGGSGKLIFDYYRVAYEKVFPDLKGEANVFISNWDGSHLTPITNGLNNVNHIESTSADGQLVLVSSHPDYRAKGDLYLLHLNSPNSTPIKLAGGLAWSQWPQAIFLDNARVAYIGRGQEYFGGLYTVNMDGTTRKKLGTLQAEFGGMVLADQSRIYYKGWTKRSSISLWWINMDGSGQGKLESNGNQILPNEFFYAGTGEAASFSPDGTKIAWIPDELEPDCPYLYLAFWTPDIRNGKYTEFVANNARSEYKDSPHVGKVIDTAYVEENVRKCFILHIASLSNLDNDTRIPLIPPFDPKKDDFYYHRDYALKWWPDSSKILVYDNGSALGRWRATDHYPISLYELQIESTSPRLELLRILSNSSIIQPGRGAGFRFVDTYGSFKFSPDGRQILFTKYNYGNNGSMIKFLNLETLNYIDDFSLKRTPDFQINRVGNIYWLP